MFGILILNGKKFSDGKKTKYLCKNGNEEVKLSYEIKLGFNKNIINKYISYILKDNIFTIDNVFGDVNDYNAYMQYELALINNIELNKKDKIFKASCNIITSDNITPSSDEFIFSIDNDDTKDYDDAVSISDDNIHIYISDVPYILNRYNLFDHIFRTTSIYLPNKVINMLPEILSSDLCSLVENTTKHVIHMMIKKDHLYIISIDEVFINKNFRYESNELLNNDNYKKLFNRVVEMNNKEKFVDKINDSHNVIEYLMIFMNYKMSEIIDNGIYRECTKGNIYIENFCYGGGGGYSLNKKGHEVLGLKSYLHITSPIRRLVDIINIMLFTNMVGGNYDLSFINKWKDNINDINISMKKIRKLQNRVKFIHMALNSDILNKPYIGHIFNEKEKNNVYSYLAYFPELKVVLPFKNIEKLDMNIIHFFNLYLFMNEGNPKNKIKVEKISF